MRQDERERPQVAPGEVQDGYWDKFHLQKSGDSLAQDAQGRSGVTIPGGVQATCRCGTEGCGYWASQIAATVFKTSTY